VAAEGRPGHGLYIHVPFCTSVCPYCDFAVLIAGRERRAAFVPALLAEADRYRDWAGTFDSLYLGGGTPSSLAAGQLELLLTGVRQRLRLSPEARVVLEANPEDVSTESLGRWLALGVTDLSLGIQSLDPEILRFLDRRHSAEEGRRSVELALAAGFRWVSVDLIFGAAGQSTEMWREQLRQGVAAAPNHLSCYQLTVHPGTRFGARRERGELLEADQAVLAELFRLTHSFLADAGYEGYEVSSFAASPAERSAHNPKYWDHTPYLGLGPSAHSFDGRRRWWNQRKLRLWQASLARGESPVEGREELGPGELALEAVMLGLRTADGVDLEWVRRRCGIDLLEANGPLVERLVDEELLRVQGDRLRSTLGGLAVADSLACLFEIDAAIA